MKKLVESSGFRIAIVGFMASVATLFLARFAITLTLTWIGYLAFPLAVIWFIAGMNKSKSKILVCTFLTFGLFMFTRSIFFSVFMPLLGYVFGLWLNHKLHRPIAEGRTE